MTPVHLPFTPPGVYWPQPWVWLLALLPALPWLWLWRRRSAPPATLRYSHIALPNAAGSSWHRVIIRLPGALRLIALTALLVAVARPQRADATRHQFVDGVAIQMVLDTSWSMHDSDLSAPGERRTRLDVVKEVFRHFVLGDEQLPGRPHDLVGVVRFARFADDLCPLTLDHDTLLGALAALSIPADHLGQPLDEARNTAIGDGLALAVERLKDVRRETTSDTPLTIRSRAVILLTDGENNFGQITPRQAGELAALYGIKVYTIIAGTGQILGTRRMPIDDADLRWIAAVSGGRHYAARDPRALAEICAEIDRLEPTRIEERQYLTWRDVTAPWLWTALAALAAATCLEATWLRRLP